MKIEYGYSIEEEDIIMTGYTTREEAINDGMVIVEGGYDYGYSMEVCKDDVKAMHHYLKQYIGTSDFFDNMAEYFYNNGNYHFDNLEMTKEQQNCFNRLLAELCLQFINQTGYETGVFEIKEKEKFK